MFPVDVIRGIYTYRSVTLVEQIVYVNRVRPYIYDGRSTFDRRP